MSASRFLALRKKAKKKAEKQRGGKIITFPITESWPFIIKTNGMRPPKGRVKKDMVKLVLQLRRTLKMSNEGKHGGKHAATQ